MQLDELHSIVLDIIRKQAPAFEQPLGLDTPIGSEGLGLDSIGLLDLILELERGTNILIRGETLTAEALATPAAIVNYLLAIQSQ